MMARTHAAFGFLKGLILIPFFNPANQILFVALAVFGSLFPDIDHPKAKLGSKIKIVGRLFEHRGFFHSIFALFIFSLLTFFLLKQEVYFWAFGAGFFTHLALDSFTRKGITPFNPFSKFKLKGMVKTNGLVETSLFVVFIVLGILRLASF
ncbi:metal-dependent hydrolase [Nanoarchaeota archaeon]